MDYRLNYKERSQDNDKAIADTQQQSYPSEFDDYFNLFATYNNEDVCEGAYGSGDDYNGKELCFMFIYIGEWQSIYPH